MRFDWKDYSADTMLFVEDWLDDCAVRMTGIEDGWRAFHEYLISDGETTIGKDYWCKVAYLDNIPVAVIALCLDDGVYGILEFIVDPKLRGKGYGAAIMQELLSNGTAIIGREIEEADAVIFPNNIASQKAFEKVGFVFDHAHVDGDAWYYCYNIR